MNYSKLYYADLCAVQKHIHNLDNLNGKKIFITGATGLIGSCVVDFLINLNDSQKANNTIYIGVHNSSNAKKRFNSFLNRKDLKCIDYNALNDLNFEIDFDYIVHAASPASPDLYVSEPVETMLCNILGLKNLLDYCRKHTSIRILYISSSEVYGTKDDTNPFKPKEYGYLDILGRRASYPSAKRASETLCNAYANEYGIQVLLVRPGHVFGPTSNLYDQRASSKFFYDVINGNNIIMKSAGSQLRSYCYVVDCVSAIITVLINGEVCQPYNIAYKDSHISIRQMADIIAECGGKQVIYENPDDREKVSFNMMNNSCLDPSDLYNLGWCNEFDCSEGLRHTFDIMSIS